MTGQVLIAGGGIAGLALARALALRRVPHAVAERAAAPPAAGLGINLPGNALRALAALGLADAVVDRGVRIRRRDYRNAAGRLLFTVAEEAFWAGVGPSVCLRHAELLRILGAGAGVRWATAVAEATPDGGAVRVRLGSGEVESYAYLAGADGVHSAVRAAVAGDRGVRRSMMTDASWRFLAPNPGVDCWTVWSGTAGTLLLIPVDAEHVYGYAAATRGSVGRADPDWLAATFDGFAEPVPGTVATVLSGGGELYYAPVEEVRCEPWHRGRITLLGDAAHATAPVWAQGAALAVEDALVLAELLATTSDWAAVGAAFERRQRPRARHVQAATDRMSRLAGLPGRLRDVVGPWLGPRAYRAAYGPLRTPALEP